MACVALKRIFSAMPMDKPQVVVWFVPSDSILTQTIHTLSNLEHEYRLRLNQDFAGRVGSIGISFLWSPVFPLFSGLFY